MTPGETRKVRVNIRGCVQGVWFRGWTVQEATRLGLDGWVRNLADSSVEAIFSGGERAVRAMVELCRQGPPHARVTEIEDGPFEGEVAPGFRQVR